jgi:hypothetical protein
VIATPSEVQTVKAPAPEEGESSAGEAFEPGSDVSGLQHVPVRVLLLALLILFVNSWFSAHLNVDLKTLLMIEAVAALIAAVRKPLGKDDAKSIDLALRRAVEFLLGTRFLMAAFAILLLGTSLVSSATLFAAGVERVGKVKFCAEGEPQCAERDLRGGDQSLRFIRLTNPFGRPFYLDAQGFRRHSFQLYPWFPKIIRASTDLQRSPSILFRVEYPHQDLVEGQIRIIDSASGREIAVGRTGGESAALLVGPDGQVPESFTVRWTRQLAAGGHPAGAHPPAIEAWFNPSRDATVTLTPGQKIDAYFLDRGQAQQKAPFADYAAVARGVIVGGGSPQDVVLKRGR